MNLTLQVAVLLADGVSREQVAERLGLSAIAIRGAALRIEAIAEQITRDDEELPR